MVFTTQYKKQRIMNKLQKIKSIIIINIVLITVCLFSMMSELEGYYSFYKKEKPNIANRLQKFCEMEPINIFGKYTGFETGYGFFGPNVSSDFIFDIHVYDENGKLMKTLDKIPAKTKEGNLRLSCINNMFLDKLDEIDKKYDRYLDIIMEQIAKKIKKDQPKNYKVEMKMYLYEYPSIKNFGKGDTTPKKIMIKKYEV